MKHMIRNEYIRKIWGEWRIGSWLFGVGSALFVVIVFSLAFAYLAPNSWGITGQVRDRLPFPVVMIGWQSAASFHDVARSLSSVRHFYESQDFSSVGMRVDFTTEDGKKRLKIREREIINRMIENDVIRRLADRDGISVTEEQATQAVSDQLKVKGNDTKAVEDRLTKLYGWNIPEFTENVVRPSLYEEELTKRFEADSLRFAAAKGKADDARKSLDDSRSFSDVAHDFSDGRTADKGGDIGWISYDALAAPLQDVAKKQKIGVPTGVIESGLGFHIIVVNERKTENGKELVELSQIFLKKQTFGDWLAEEMKGMPVHVLAPEYEWNRDPARVEFRDPVLQDFEKNLLQNSEGDASVQF